MEPFSFPAPGTAPQLLAQSTLALAGACPRADAACAIADSESGALITPVLVVA